MIGRKKILWATTFTLFSIEEGKNLLSEVFAELKKIDNVMILIKQHPAEKKEHTQLIKRYLSKYSIDSIFIDKQENITPYIYICDILIHHGSTCGQEAIIFKKPMIILKHANSLINGGYEKEGVGIILTKPDNLKSVIESVLDEPTFALVNYDEYVKKYMYKIDDKSSQRCVTTIVNLISENQ